MNIGLFGGQFDPFHNGHESIIRGALKSGIIDAVIVIPSARNPFKTGSQVSAAPYRFYMTKNAVEQDFEGENVFVSDVEFMYSGTSYTVTTIKQITKPSYIRTFLGSCGVKQKQAHQNHKYYWLTGSDVLPKFDQWYEPEKILEQAGLLVASRPGDGVDVDEQIARLRKLFGPSADIRSFRTEQVAAASSDIRAGHDLSEVPESVKEFIAAHALYSDEDPLMSVSQKTAEDYYENAIKLYRYLGQKRLLHTLNVGILSARYALRYDTSLCDRALIAGQLHDCAKELDESLQKEMAYRYSGELFTEKKLLHSPAGALFALEEFGITDPDILDAITYHTTGRGNMSLLEKIVYLADKLEPSRTYADLEKERHTAFTDLDEALRMVAASMKRKFESRGQEMHPLSLDFMSDLGL